MLAFVCLFEHITGIQEITVKKTPLLLLFAQVIALPTIVAAGEAKMTVKLDGKALFVPEVQLTKKMNPVMMLLYMGSWRSSAKAPIVEKSMGALDLKNNQLVLESPDELLENSKPRVLKRDSLNSYLNAIIWGKITRGSRQVTQFAFKAVSGRRQSAVIDMFADSDVVMFLNGKPAGGVSADNILASGGRGCLPIMLETGENIISIKQFSKGKPRIEVSVRLDHSHDLEAAWQSQNGLLKKPVIGPREHAVADWSPGLGSFSVSIEVRDVAADTIVLQKNPAHRGKALDDAAARLAPGIYEAVYRTQNESASEYFIVGNPRDIFAGLSDRLANYNATPEAKLDIEAQLIRARILLADDNYNPIDRQWQEKIAYTFGSLASMERRLRNGVTNIAKDQPGLHIRGFASKADDSFQSYRLFIPSQYKPDTPLPLLVVVSTGVSKPDRPFVAGPVMANQREALLWSKYAEKHGFAILWPGYRGIPKGYTYESVHIDEAIHAVEKDYNIDKQRISVYATCGAGYYAGRLISEYSNRFAGIVYDRAVFDFPPSDLEQPSPSIVEWLEAASPVPRVLGNQNLKIFVMHDDTKPEGHGPMELTTKFLEQAREARNDVVSYLSKRPMSDIERMDMLFSWLAPCRNMNPGDTRSHFLEQCGYQGPIMEIFTTPVIIVEGSRALDVDKNIMHAIAESIRNDYKTYFHGAECIVKKDENVTQDDIKNNSLVLIGNSVYNSVWERLRPSIPLKISLNQVLYKNQAIAKGYMFEAVTRHPDAPGKYILMIGTGDVKYLQSVITSNLFNAWYDCLVFSTPFKIIGKLDDINFQRQP